MGGYKEKHKTVMIKEKCPGYILPEATRTCELNPKKGRYTFKNGSRCIACGGKGFSTKQGKKLYQCKPTAIYLKTPQDWKFDLEFFDFENEAGEMMACEPFFIQHPEMTKY